MGTNTVGLVAETGTNRGPRHGQRDTRRRMSTTKKAMLGLVACTALAVVCMSALFVYAARQLDAQITRIPEAFPAEGTRPAPSAEVDGNRPINILLLASDRRPDEAQSAPDEWVPGLERSDTIMVLHIDADRERASVVSIPRDAWVEVPGHGFNKINAAFSYGGMPLAVQTIEQLTDVRLDHVAVIDWTGFEHLTDVLGGVEVTVKETVHDSYRNHTWTAGDHHLDGAAALLYVRQRVGLPGGDLGRVQRQHHFMRALVREAVDRIGPTNPRESYRILDALTANLAVDDEWEAGHMRKLFWQLQDMTAGDIDFLTTPVAGYGREGAQSVVRLDDFHGAELWRAVREDTVEAWTEQNTQFKTRRSVS